MEKLGAVRQMLETGALDAALSRLTGGDPRRDPAARRISRVEKITPAIEALAGGAGSSRGTGGMATKLKAARIAHSQGIAMAIVSGSDPQSLYQLLNGEDVGTLFPAG